MLILLYRFGARLPGAGSSVPNMLCSLPEWSCFQWCYGGADLFSGGSFAYVRFSLGIRPYITAQIILQMMQSVIPSLGELKRWRVASVRLRSIRAISPLFALLNAVGYLFMFKAMVSFANMGGVPERLNILSSLPCLLAPLLSCGLVVKYPAWRR